MVLRILNLKMGGWTRLLVVLHGTFVIYKHEDYIKALCILDDIRVGRLRGGSSV